MPERKEFSYSIWLMPEGKDYQRLAAITNRLSKEYKSPQIRPHVTLVGGFVGDVEKFLYLAEGLARDISPINVELGAIGTFDEFFRSVFLRAKKSNGLMVAYETVSNMIPDIDPHFSPNSQTYLPHLSLIYGNFDPAKKQKIVESVQMPQRGFRATGFYCVANNERDKVWPELARFELTG